MNEIKILKAEKPPKNDGKWADLIRKMKHHQSVVMDNELDAKSFTIAVKNLGRYTTRLKTGSGWRCWVSDKPLAPKKTYKKATW